VGQHQGFVRGEEEGGGEGEEEVKRAARL
jgi:hypothetical protein